MSDHDTRSNRTITEKRDKTAWQRLASTEPIRIHDPLAETLGMVAEGEPFVMIFADVAKAADHACPAVAGAYRSTQLALDNLYIDEYPLWSDIEVTVGGDPDGHGFGPMANVVQHITGAADETGFAGFGEMGDRGNLLSFGEVDASGCAFRFERMDTRTPVTISFDPSTVGVDPDNGGSAPMWILSKIVAGDTDDRQAAAFRDQ